MSYRETILRRVLIVGLFIASAGTICNTAFGLSPGWPAGPIPTPLPTPPATPTPSPTPFPTPTPAVTPLPTPVPPSYVQVITVESPQLQYRDGSMSVGTQSPPGALITAVIAMYLNSTDPTQFEIVRTFQPRFPGNVYGPSQPVSSPTVSASYTHTGQLANNVTMLTVYPHPENPYGKETLSVYTLDSHGNIILPALNAGSIPILVYPVSTAKIYNSLSYFPTSAPASSPSSGFATSPPSTTSVLALSQSLSLRDSLPVSGCGCYPQPPSELHGRYGAIRRRNRQRLPWRHHLGCCLSRSTLGNTTVICQGSCQQSPNCTNDRPGSRSGTSSLKSGRGQTPQGGLLFPATTTPTAYTVQVVQFRPPYGTNGMETLATANFTVVSSSFKVNSQVGKLTP